MINSNRLETGKRIRDLRLSHHLTQAQFAESLDVSTNFISEIETGKKGVSQYMLYRLCEQYDLSADYLLFGKENFTLSHSTLSEFLSSLSEDDIHVVIEYLKAMLKLKEVEKKQKEYKSNIK